MDVKLGEAFKRAWKITGRFKSLSVLSFFQIGGPYLILTSLLLFPPVLTAIIRPFITVIERTVASGYGYSAATSDQLALQLVASVLAPFLIVCVIGFVLWLATWIVGVIAQGGLLKETEVADRGQIAAAGSGWRKGGKYFWRIVGLSIVFSIPLVVVLSIYYGITIASTIGQVSSALSSTMSSASAYAAGDSAAVGSMVGSYFTSIFSSMIFFVIEIAFALFFGTLLRYALRAGVLEDLPFGKAISRAWQIFKTNIKNSLLAFLIDYATSIAVSFVLAIVLGVVVVVAIFGGVASLANIGDPTSVAEAVNAIQPFFWSLFIAVFISMVVMSLGLSVYGTFSESFWTIIYRRITGLSAAEMHAASQVPTAPLAPAPVEGDTVAMPSVVAQASPTAEIKPATGDAPTEEIKPARDDEHQAEEK